MKFKPGDLLIPRVLPKDSKVLFDICLVLESGHWNKDLVIGFGDGWYEVFFFNEQAKTRHTQTWTEDAYRVLR